MHLRYVYILSTNSKLCTRNKAWKINSHIMKQRSGYPGEVKRYALFVRYLLFWLNISNLSIITLSVLQVRLKIQKLELLSKFEETVVI